MNIWLTTPMYSYDSMLKNYVSGIIKPFGGHLRIGRNLKKGFTTQRNDREAKLSLEKHPKNAESI